MAVIEVQPFIIHNAVIQFDEDDFAKAVSTATLTPSGSVVTFEGQKPDAVYTFPTTVTWTLELTYAQDWSAEDSLSRFLFLNQGAVLPATLNPNDAAAGSTSWAINVAIVPGSVGGDVNTVATATVQLGVSGQPVPTFTPAAVMDQPPAPVVEPEN